MYTPSKGQLICHIALMGNNSRYISCGRKGSANANADKLQRFEVLSLYFVEYLNLGSDEHLTRIGLKSYHHGDNHWITAVNKNNTDPIEIRSDGEELRQYEYFDIFVDKGTNNKILLRSWNQGRWVGVGEGDQTILRGDADADAKYTLSLIDDPSKVSEGTSLITNILSIASIIKQGTDLIIGIVNAARAIGGIFSIDGAPLNDLPSIIDGIYLPKKDGAGIFIPQYPKK